MNLGSEHQELQVAALADAAELPQPTPSAPHRHSSAEQPHGAVVLDALPDAARLPVAQGIQGVVFESSHWNDRRKHGIQRESREKTSQGALSFRSDEKIILGYFLLLLVENSFNNTITSLMCSEYHVKF